MNQLKCKTPKAFATHWGACEHHDMYVRKVMKGTQYGLFIF